GGIRYGRAAGCPPRFLDGRMGDVRFAGTTDDGPLGAAAGRARHEASLRLTASSTLLLFTGGLVQSRAVARATGLRHLREAARRGPDELGALCEHVLNACTGTLRRDDDICLLGVRL